MDDGTSATAAGEAQDLYRALVEEASDAIFVSDAEGRYVFVNRSACELLGYDRPELLGMSIHDVVGAEELEAAPLRLDALRAGLSVRSERQLIRKDGSRVQAELRSRKLEDGRLFAFVRDVSPRVEVERALLESEQLLRELGTNLPSLFWVREASSGALLYANPRWSRVLGHEPVLGDHFRQLFTVVHPEDLDRVKASAARATDGEFDEVIRMVEHEAGLRWFHVQTFAIRDGQGRPRRIVGLGEDITDQRAALEALRASEAKYRNLFENAQVGIYRSKLDGSGFLDVNRKFCELFEGSRDELLRTPAHRLWKAPGERNEMIRQLRETGVIQYEAQVTTFRGNARSLLASGVAYPELGYFEGTAIDVTERKKTERALIDSEARYRSVVQAMSDGIVVHGADGAIVTANAAAERILGLTVDQMMGRTSLDPRWRAIREDGSPFPGEEHPGWVTLHTGEPRTGVIMGVHKPSGELTWISITSRRITPPGEEGAYSVVASFTDVTERLRADERIHASLREKEVLLREIHHRVKNNLQIVSSLLYLQSNRVEDERLAGLLRESQNRVASMALIHQQLYESADLSRIPFSTYACDLARSLYESYGVASERIRLDVSAGDIVLSIGAAVPCGLILNEILSNALKHAYPGEARGTIAVELELQGDRYRLRVSDDGVGLPPDFERRARTSLGTKLLDRLVAQIGGELRRTSSGAGTRYELTFPLEALS